MKTRTFTIAAMLVLAGCTTAWHRPDMMADATAQSQFSMDDARCRLMARAANSGGGFYAYGSKAVVGTAAGLYVLGTALSTQATYEDCMRATGYLPGTGNAAPAAQAAAGQSDWTDSPEMAAYRICYPIGGNTTSTLAYKNCIDEQHAKMRAAPSESLATRAFRVCHEIQNITTNPALDDCLNRENPGRQ